MNMKKEQILKELSGLVNHLEVMGAVRCRVCGGSMAMGSSGLGGIKYTCEKAVEGWRKDKYSVRSEWWKHLNRSEFIVTNEGSRGTYETTAICIRNIIDGRSWDYHPEAERFLTTMGMEWVFK